MALSEAEKIVVALTDGAEETFGLGELARAIDDEAATRASSLTFFTTWTCSDSSGSQVPTEKNGA